MQFIYYKIFITELEILLHNFDNYLRFTIKVENYFFHGVFLSHRENTLEI